MSLSSQCLQCHEQSELSVILYSARPIGISLILFASALGSFLNIPEFLQQNTNTKGFVFGKQNKSRNIWTSQVQMC